jgi:uncharacterized RDD family membrane protein YckC
MSWYYQDGIEEVGPISKSELQELIKAKQINAQTLVRNISMPEWRPLVELVHGGDQKANRSQTPIHQPEASPGQAVSTAPGDSVETAVCSQCGRSFPSDQVVYFDQQAICTACKPMFVQRLREGVTQPGVLNYGGFWIRFGAKIIDWVILGVLQYAIIIPLGLMSVSSMESASTPLMFMGLSQLISLLIPAVYNTFFVGRFAATPGKMACRLKIVAPDGGRISYLRALGRNFAEIVSALILLIGYVIAAFDGEKRALHDRICSTRVVFK